METFNLTNEVHVAMQMLCIVLWMVLFRHLYEKRNYTGSHFYWIISFAVNATMLSLLSELIKNDFVLTWNLWYWYPTNWALQISIYMGVNLVEKLKDEILYLKNEIKKLKDEKINRTGL